MERREVGLGHPFGVISTREAWPIRQPHHMDMAQAETALIRDSSLPTPSLFPPTYMPLICLHKAPNSLWHPPFSPISLSLPTSPCIPPCNRLLLG
jgi:hypothetical protein